MNVEKDSKDSNVGFLTAITKQRVLWFQDIITELRNVAS